MHAHSIRGKHFMPLPYLCTIPVCKRNSIRGTKRLFPASARLPSAREASASQCTPLFLSKHSSPLLYCLCTTLVCTRSLCISMHAHAAHLKACNFGSALVPFIRTQKIRSVVSSFQRVLISEGVQGRIIIESHYTPT